MLRERKKRVLWITMVLIITLSLIPFSVKAAFVNDVAVTSVTITTTTTILQGENVTLTVTVQNLGTNTTSQTVTVGIYYGPSGGPYNTLAQAQDTSSKKFVPENITLAFGATVTRTYDWITSKYPSVPIGNQVVMANATIVGPADDNPTDNTKVDGTVSVNQHDVGITNVTTNMTKVVQGHNVTITVTVHNYAIKTETNNGQNITVYAYYNTSSTQALRKNIVSMTAGETKVLTYTWDTGGKSLGSALVDNGTYTIKTQILPAVSFDNNATNDLKVDGKVQVAAHDIEVLNMFGTPTGVSAGQTVTLKVLVHNEGNFTESFNVNAYWNTTHVIGTQAVSNLLRGQKVNATFSWNTVGLSNGKYFLNGTAVPVALELHKTDNTLALQNWVVNIPKAHDVALTLGYTNTSYAKPGDIVAIYATVANQGDYSESSVTVNTYYGTTPAASPQTTSIANRTNTALDYPQKLLTFYWDTSVVSYGTYNIWINITAVSGEVNTRNNNYLAGQVIFTRMYVSPSPKVANVSAVLNSKPSTYVNPTASAVTMYAHQETTLISGTPYYYLKFGSADAAGLNLTASMNSVARVLAGKIVLPLNGLNTTSATTWTFNYRATASGGTAHADVDILVRQSTGAIRTTFGTSKAPSGAFTTAWTTLTGTYAFSGYTVVAQTDYLEIDYYINVTALSNGKVAAIRIDDNTLAAASQTRITGAQFSIAFFNGGNAFDNNPSSYAYYMTNAAGTIDIKAFNNSAGGSLAIVGVDVKITYAAPRVAGGNDKFTILWFVSPSTSQTALRTATPSDTDVPLATYVFPATKTPAGDPWNWTAISNIVIRFQSTFAAGPTATSDPENRQVQIYDISVTVYTTPIYVQVKASGAQDLFAWGVRVNYNPAVLRAFGASNVSTYYPYYMLKQTGADAAGINGTQAPVGTVGRKLAAKTVFSFNGITSITGTTWTLYYRAAASGGTAHGDVDILIRRDDNGIRSTIATNVGTSGTFTTAWTTVSGTYAFPGYTVVAQTDYLEIDYYIDITVAATGGNANIRIDDNSLATSNQTRITNIGASAMTLYAHREEAVIGGLLHRYPNPISGWDEPSFFAVVNVTGGYIDLGQTITGNHPGVTGSGYLANITFVVLSAGETGLNLTKLSMQNSFLQPIPLYGENGKFSSAHDVIVTSIVKNSPRAYYYKGLKVTYTMTVTSFGPWTETFTLYLYTNLTVPAINSTVVSSLKPLESRTVTLSWNTTTYAYGQHKIRAETSTVTGDINPGNNVKTDGTTMLTIPGDANGDKAINVFDILAVKSRWGTTPASPNWIPEYDVNDDSAINVFDILTIKSKWGQSW